MSLGPWLILLTARAADPWAGSCEERGGTTWGRLDAVIPHHGVLEDGVLEDEHYRHVRVHRPIEKVRLQRFVRMSTPAKPGMMLCHGDWVESWRDVDVVLQEAGASALLTLRGRSLLWLDEQLRQVHGVVDYYVLDDPDDPDRPTPVPVTIGHSSATASRQDSIFRLEVLDPASGEARLTVSPDGDVFSTTPRSHGVTVAELGGNRVRVQGGQSVRLLEGRRLASDPDRDVQAAQELSRAREQLDERAREAFDRPERSIDERSVRQHLILQGRAYPERVSIDGEEQRRREWRPVRWPDGGHGLISVDPVRLEPGPHRIQVHSWGDTVEVHATTSSDATPIPIPRAGLPPGSGWSVRPDPIAPFAFVAPAELRPSVGFGLLRTLAGEREQRNLGDRFEGEEAWSDAVSLGMVAELPVRWLIHGGRAWVEVSPRGGVMLGPVGEHEDAEGTTTALVADAPIGWLAGSAWGGLTVGYRLRLELGAGLLTTPRFGQGAGLWPRQQGVAAAPAGRVEISYGIAWTVSGELRTTLGSCAFAVEPCPTTEHLLGVRIQRNQGRFSPFLQGRRRETLIQTAGALRPVPTGESVKNSLSGETSWTLDFGFVLRPGGVR